MQIVTVGLNHKTAPVEVREKVALLEEELPAALSGLAYFTAEGAILSTCNRTEIYTCLSDGWPGGDGLKAFLAGYHGIPLDELTSFLYTYSQEEAVRHLFQVASGLDSMILGEREILGQVRDALVTASAAGTVGTPLSRLFHAALHTGRKAREQTGISRHAVSVSYAAVEMARQVFGELERCRVLVISAGEAGKLTAKGLREGGVCEIGVANRTPVRALALAQALGGRPVAFGGLGEALADYDIVISATASARFVLPAAMVAQAMARRAGRPLCLIDIAVPRDVDPESRKIEGVYLYDIDDLEAVSGASMEGPKKAIAQAQSIVDVEVQKFMQWLRSLEVVPLIKSLRSRVEHLRLQEVQKSLRKLRHLSTEDQERIEILTKALTRRILHDPIVALKRRGQRKGYVEAAREFFRLEEESQGPSGNS